MGWGVKGWVTAGPRAHAQLVKMIFVAALQPTIFVRDLLGFSTCDSLIRYECVYFQRHKYGNPESTPSHPHPISKFVCFCLHNAPPNHIILYDPRCSSPTPSGGVRAVQLALLDQASSALYGANRWYLAKTHSLWASCPTKRLSVIVRNLR